MSFLGEDAWWRHLGFGASPFTIGQTSSTVSYCGTPAAGCSSAGSRACKFCINLFALVCEAKFSIHDSSPRCSRLLLSATGEERCLSCDIHLAFIHMFMLKIKRKSRPDHDPHQPQIDVRSTFVAYIVCFRGNPYSGYRVQPRCALVSKKARGAWILHQRKPCSHITTAPALTILRRAKSSCIFPDGMDKVLPFSSLFSRLCLSNTNEPHECKPTNTSAPSR
jgi:hypothetical protein